MIEFLLHSRYPKSLKLELPPAPEHDFQTHTKIPKSGPKHAKVTSNRSLSLLILRHDVKTCHFFFWSRSLPPAHLRMGCCKLALRGGTPACNPPKDGGQQADVACCFFPGIVFCFRGLANESGLLCLSERYFSLKRCSYFVVLFGGKVAVSYFTHLSPKTPFSYCNIFVSSMYSIYVRWT